MLKSYCLQMKGCLEMFEVSIYSAVFTDVPVFVLCLVIFGGALLCMRSTHLSMWSRVLTRLLQINKIMLYTNCVHSTCRWSCQVHIQGHSSILLKKAINLSHGSAFGCDMSRFPHFLDIQLTDGSQGVYPYMPAAPYHQGYSW